MAHFVDCRRASQSDCCRITAPNDKGIAVLLKMADLKENAI